MAAKMDQDPRRFQARTAHGTEAQDVTYPHSSWGALMQAQEAAYGEKPWLVYRNERGDRSVWSYAVFVDTARRLASLLSQHGVQRGDRVVIAGHNHPDTILSYFACWLLGACAVPLNMTEDDNRLTYIANNCGARVFLCRSSYRQRLESSVDLPSNADLIEVDTEASTDPIFYRDVRAQAPYPFPDPSADMRWDECMIVYH